MQGWRNNQEDAEILSVPFDDDENSCLFAVFDGHGSDLVSNFSAAYFGQVLKANANYKSGNYSKALTETFQKMDKVMLSKPGRRILFQNILNKDNGKAYYFPKDVNFDEDVTLDPTNIIDNSILLEDKVLAKFQKLPEYYNPKEIIDENPELRPKEKEMDTILKLSISFCGGCTANVGLLKNGQFYCSNAGDSRGVA